MEGKILFGKYTILKCLGKNDYDDIYLAEHIKLRVHRVIKRIYRRNPLYEQLLNEANILKNLKHSNIPVIYDIEEDEEFSYIIEEYIKGKSLKVYKIVQGNISERNILNYAIQICELFIYLHSPPQPVLYLDLKPENILIDNGVLKLVDFGAAVYLKDMEKLQYSMGTKGYASPEQYLLKSIDERSDIYGIGMLLFFLVTGESYDLKMKHVHGVKKIKGCSRALKSVIDKCLRYYPSQRYSSVEKLKNTLFDIKSKGKQNCFLSDASHTISIAGSQPRIGTTHTALLLSSYINEFLGKSLYVSNDENVINSIVNINRGIKSEANICHLKNLNFLFNSEESEDNKYLEVYPYKIKDFGVLTEEKRENFLKGDINILVLGGKDWEIHRSLEIIRIMKDYENVKYIFNFTNEVLYRNIIKLYNIPHCCRMPYAGDCFSVKDKNVIRFFKKLLNEYG